MNLLPYIPTIILAQASIVLQPITKAHESLFIELEEDSRVMENHFAFDNNKRHNSIRNLLQHMIKNDIGLYHCQVIYINKEMVGIINLFEDKLNKNNIFISYSILPSYWNKGIGTKAIKEIITLFLPDMKKRNIKTITAVVKSDNKGSRRVLEKNGFVLSNQGKLRVINGFAAYTYIKHIT